MSPLTGTSMSAGEAKLHTELCGISQLYACFCKGLPPIYRSKLEQLTVRD